MTQNTEPFILQRRRLGRIRHIDESGKYGFIEAEDYRQDVFFHVTTWEPAGPRDTAPRKGQFVEFEIDELYRRSEGKLRALAVRGTSRPDGDRLRAKNDPHLQVQHHPKARQKKPAWRRKPE